MIYTLSLARARDPVNSHVTQIHSPKRCKFRKYAVWEHRQLVLGEPKDAAGKRQETVRHTLPAITAPSRVRQCEHTRDKCVCVQYTHVICDMPWKASGSTDVMPLRLSSSIPFSVGQEPLRTSGAPSVLPLKVQPPNTTFQSSAEAPLDKVSSTANKRRLFMSPTVRR